jgi:hypothetical protein
MLSAWRRSRDRDAPGAWSLASAYRAQLRIVHLVPTPPAYQHIDLEEHTRQFAPHTVVDALVAEGFHKEVLRHS